MVTRKYDAPDFGVRDQRTALQGQVGGPGQATGAAIQVGDADWRGNMLSQFARQGAEHLDKMADIEFSNLYLEGQAAAGVIESEAELQGNTLTRDWKVAGYRDTMGKLALADSEAKFSVDLKTLREGSSEDLQGYLAKRRAEIMPGIAGMSREARAAATGQLLLQDRAAVQSWTSEHTKFVIEQKQKAIATQHNVALASMGAAQAKFRMGDTTEKDFNAQVQATAGTMVGSVWMDSSLPEDVKQNMTFEMLQMTLGNDSVELYDFLAQNALPDGTGGTSTLLSRLPMPKQQQIANAYREAQSRTNDQRNMRDLATVATIEAHIQTNKFDKGYAELAETLDPLVQRKVISGEKAAGILKAFTVKQLEAQAGANLRTLAITGDTHGIFSAGATHEQAMKALDEHLASSGATPDVRLNSYLTAGVNGTDGAFQRAGAMLSSSLRQIRQPDGTVLPQHKQVYETIAAAVTRAESGSNPNMNARMQLLSGMGEQDRTFLTRVWALQEKPFSRSLDAALAEAADTEAREAAMTPAMRAALNTGSGAVMAQAVNDLEPKNLFESMWGSVKGLFSSEAAADKGFEIRSQFGTRDGWYGDSPTAMLYVDDLKKEITAAGSRIQLAAPLTSPDDLVLQAKADVASRTIKSANGTIILPHKANAAQVFGVKPGNVSQIGPAIDDILKETKRDSRWHVQYTHRGVQATEFDSKGVQIGNPRYLKPTEVAKAVEARVKAESDKAGHIFGKGKVHSADGVQVRFNGQNTVGVNDEWMFGFRENLVQNEGVKGTPYKDLSGKKDKAGNPIMTVGVGVSSHNPHYPKAGPDGKVSSEAISSSFLGASNDAALRGRQITHDFKLDANSKATFQLMSELAYQSGGSFATAQKSKTEYTKTAVKYRVFLNALKNGHPELAKEAFKQTAAWHYSGDPKARLLETRRQKHYLKLIDQIYKGE